MASAALSSPPSPVESSLGSSRASASCSSASSPPSPPRSSCQPRRPLPPPLCSPAYLRLRPSLVLWPRTLGLLRRLGHNLFFLLLIFSLAPLPLVLLELRRPKALDKYTLKPKVRLPPASVIKCYKDVMRAFLLVVGPLQLSSYPAVKVSNWLEPDGVAIAFWMGNILTAFGVLREGHNFKIKIKLISNSEDQNVHKFGEAPDCVSLPTAPVEEQLFEIFGEVCQGVRSSMLSFNVQ